MIKKVYVVRVLRKGCGLGFISKISYDYTECWEHIKHINEVSRYKEFIIEVHTCTVVNEKNPNAREDYDSYLISDIGNVEKFNIKFENPV